jgi:CHAT domain-containing protein
VEPDKLDKKNQPRAANSSLHPFYWAAFVFSGDWN